MKLDTSALRYLTADDWRVLAAVEQGSKNHELVPTPLISQIAGLRGGNSVHKCISNLAKVGLIAKIKNARYDGYRLTYGGLDYLALNTYRRSDTITSVGNQIGVGKESDIFVVANPASQQLVLKLHRLGRISFRTVKANRDYLRNRSTGSWMYLSRLAAQKEYAFMRVLHREGFPVPEPISWSRHTLVMQFIDAFPLRMISSVPEPGKLYAELMALIVKFAQRGLIHGDFNEFNILIIEHAAESDSTRNEDAPKLVKLTPIVIDFPQTLSTNHANAEFYFDRDVQCIKRYFERRFKYTSDEPGPFFQDSIKGLDAEKRLDIEVEATGFSKKMARELDKYVEIVGGDADELDGEMEKLDADADGYDTDDDDAYADQSDVHDTHAEQSTKPDELQQSQTASSTDSEQVDNIPIHSLSVSTLSDFNAARLEEESASERTAAATNDTESIAGTVKDKKKSAGWAI